MSRQPRSARIGVLSWHLPLCALWLWRMRSHPRCIPSSMLRLRPFFGSCKKRERTRKLLIFPGIYDLLHDVPDFLSILLLVFVEKNDSVKEVRRLSACFAVFFRLELLFLLASSVEFLLSSSFQCRFSRFFSSRF